MTLEEPVSTSTRRRGAELEHAILDAVWQEISEQGYGGLTYERVASRARTSRAVLYRRWPTREELVRAAVRHLGSRTPRISPDTGSLRDDVLTALRYSNESRLGMWVVLSVQLAGFYAETGITPADLRRELIGDAPTPFADAIARAVERGEARAGLPERVMRVPFDLFRSEAILRLGRVPDEDLVSIVDDVFLPLVRPVGGAGEPPADGSAS